MRLCSGCQSKVPDGVQFCYACKAERNATTGVDGIKSHTAVQGNHAAYDPELDALRKGARWQKARAAKHKEQPFCIHCQTALTEIVDHIVPASEAIRQVQESNRFPFDKYA